jgi:hypothetical protein
MHGVEFGRVFGCVRFVPDETLSASMFGIGVSVLRFVVYFSKQI